MDKKIGQHKAKVDWTQENKIGEKDKIILEWTLN